MGAKTIREVRVVLWKDGTVLACRCQEGEQPETEQAELWEFPGCPIGEDETALQAARRAVLDVVGCNPTSAWPLDTIVYDQPDSHLRMECLVAFLPPSAEEPDSERRVTRWASRNDLLEIPWHPADELVARLVGQHWDVLFASEHL